MSSSDQRKVSTSKIPQKGQFDFIEAPKSNVNELQR